jgi:hypothetical protein
VNSLHARLLFAAMCVSPELAAGSQPAPDFARDIAPIIYEKCVPCHCAGGPGPFSLTSFEDVRKHARQIAVTTRTRYMPPWLPDEQANSFAGELRLTDEQINLISDWVAADAPEGNPAETPKAPEISDGWRLEQPDLVLKAAQPFRVPADGPDVFWNFVLKPGLAQSRFVRAIDIRPSNPKIVHHANIVLDHDGSNKNDGGFPGMEVTVLGSVLDLDGHFLFWKAGTIPWSEPDGFSWRLDPGANLILNVHLQPSGKPEWEQPSIGLYFTDKPPARFPYLLQLEHDGALDIPAGDSDFVVIDSLRLPVDTQVLAIYPHAHYLGTLMEAWAVRPDGTRLQLIRIRKWDQNWQAVYRYREPVRLPAGTVVNMRFHYDNSSGNPRNPNKPPKRVQGGNQSTDEMGHLWLEVVGEGNKDDRRIYAEAWARHQIEKYPDDYYANVTLGALAITRIHPQDAIDPLHKAVALRPNDAFARNLYGVALDATGQVHAALEQFRSALEQRPDYANARFNLAHALARSGDTASAIDNLHVILAAHPGDVAAKSYLDRLTRASEANH